MNIKENTINALALALACRQAQPSHWEIDKSTQTADRDLTEYKNIMPTNT